MSSGDKSDLAAVDWPDLSKINEGRPERRGWSEREVVGNCVGGVVLVVPINGLLISSVSLGLLGSLNGINSSFVVPHCKIALFWRINSSEGWKVRNAKWH